MMSPKNLSLLLTLSLSAAGALAAERDDSRYDHRFARLSYLAGHVSFQHTGDVEWSAASINMALQPADRIYTGDDGRAEIEFDDGSVLRLAEKSDVELLTLVEERIQVRLLVGLATLTVSSSVTFEVATPAAACTTVRKGVYRFDVRDNGDTDAIVRKGVLEAVNKQISRKIESGDLIHIVSGEAGRATVTRYGNRDAWDEWNDRRDADRVAWNSRRYVPAYVNVGVRELDLYGRWITVDEYGPAWIPSYVPVGWSPYWEGRWWHRPHWGWTWLSYEPWGWLPYHYGRWHWSLGVGWAWIPGPSYGFHFWSPGLVRFYRGPSWVSWCPLGPNDYYNVNHYYYRSTYHYYLNDLRLTQRRGPSDLANRDVPGAFRTSRTEQFANDSFGRGRTIAAVEGAERPWERGRLVTERLAVEPTSRSYAPLPEAAAASRPSASIERPVVVRGDPAVTAGGDGRYVRLTNRFDGSGEAPARSSPSGAAERRGISASGASSGAAAPPAGARGSSSEPTYVPRIWDRRVLSSEPSEGRSARPGAGESRSEPRRYEGASPDRAPAGRFERQAPERAAPPGRSAPERTAPERSAPPERRPPDADRGRPEAGSASGYIPRTYAAPNYSSAPVERSAPRESSGNSYSAPNYSSTPSDRPSHSREAPSGRSFAGSSGWGAAPTYGGGSGRATVIHPGGMPSGRSAAPSSGGSPSISRGAPSARSAPRSNGAGGGVLRRGDH